MSYVFTIPMNVENIFQAYLSCILAHKDRGVAIMSDNSTVYKNKILNEVYDQQGIKRLFSNPFYTKGNAKVENVHNFLKTTLTKFLDSSHLEGDELLPFTCYCYNTFPSSNDTQCPFFLMF